MSEMLATSITERSVLLSAAVTHTRKKKKEPKRKKKRTFFTFKNFFHFLPLRSQKRQMTHKTVRKKIRLKNKKKKKKQRA